ncbi:DUF4233 domain-containing protein [Piscicoccus intestinalis]|uniref:DUF4233 domain-containing protein n=1 Tax=Piscicoccus intestinalis TaxID=746033 RepID=UPI001FDFC8BF|nr:DUF4233 domain-containing protein [Piscicoccus intestinalis]
MSPRRPSRAAGNGIGPLRGPMLLPEPRKVTGRLCAAVLGGQAPVVILGAFAARGLAGVTEPERAATYLWVGLGLGAACIVAAALTRTRLGILLGWLVQLLTLASAVAVPAMLIVTAIFGSLWVVALVQGRRMDDLTHAYVTRASASSDGAAGSADPPAGPPPRG